MSRYIIVELKKPELMEGKSQLRSYCNATGAPIGIWTNGEQISHYTTAKTRITLKGFLTFPTQTKALAGYSVRTLHAERPYILEIRLPMSVNP